MNYNFISVNLDDHPRVSVGPAQFVPYGPPASPPGWALPQVAPTQKLKDDGRFDTELVAVTVTTKSLPAS